MKKILLYLAITCITFPVNAELDKYQKSALEKTQDLLRDPGKRMDAVNESDDAKAAHQKAMNLLGSQQNVNKAYDMAAIMLKSITEEANGDPQKMQQILNNAKSNPAGLANRMPSDFKAMLKKMAGEIEGQNSPSRK